MSEHSPVKWRKKLTGALTASNHFVQRFGEKVWVADNDECWPWMAYVTPYGYGEMGTNRGGSVKAHRFMYELFFGEIPEGMEIDHLCHNRICVNPFHLEVVTRYENNMRGESWMAKNKRKEIAKCGHPLALTYGGTRRCIPCYRAYSKTYMAAYNRRKTNAQLAQ
jgi:hypothetical protein